MHHLTNPAELPSLLATWGYLGIFVFVFVGNLGVPVPEETVLIAAGFLASRSILDLEWVYVVAVASAVVGDCCGFLIGRTGGQRLLERLAERFEFVRRRIERLRLFFDQHGSKAVFMARFITGARFLAGPMAGAARVRVRPAAATARSELRRESKLSRISKLSREYKLSCKGELSR